MSYARFHWSLVNIMARMCGIWSGVFAVVAVISGVSDALSPDRVRADALTPLEGAITSVVIGAFMGVLSIVFLRTPSYRPDLGDRTWTFQVMRKSPDASGESRRSWWTGLPKDHGA
jgi:hypothetical protein